jgi:hypothetical protein
MADDIIYKISSFGVKILIIMLVAGSRSMQMRDVRVTIRSIKRDVRAVNHDMHQLADKFDAVTAHLQTVTVKLDNQTRLIRMSFSFVICMLSAMLFFTESTWFMMWTRHYM